MSLLDDLFSGNERYVQNDWSPNDADLAAPPNKRLAVVACMDTRHNVERVLGLEHGDAKIIRNAGNLLDDGTLRSLIVCVHLLGVKRIAVMGHTKCGMTIVGRGEFRIAHSIAERTGVPLHAVMLPGFQRWLGGFPDVAENVRQSIRLIRGHPYMPADLEVFGLLYDNDTGRIVEVKEESNEPVDASAPPA